MNIIYYECHITIDPFETGDQCTRIMSAVSSYGFRVAKLLMSKNGPDSTEDAFMSARDVVFEDLNDRANKVIEYLCSQGIHVRRCKIEGIIRDQRYL